MITWGGGNWGEGVWGGGSELPTPDPAPAAPSRVGFACTFAIDPATGDLPKKPYILRGVPAIAQRLRSRLRFVAGEYFLDTRLGLPYYQSVFGRVVSLTVVDAIYRKAIETCPGIVRVDSIESTLNRRKRLLSTVWSATADDGLILTAVNEPYIIFGNQAGRSY